MRLPLLLALLALAARGVEPLRPWASPRLRPGLQLAASPPDTESVGSRAAAWWQGLSGKGGAAAAPEPPPSEPEGDKEEGGLDARLRRLSIVSNGNSLAVSLRRRSSSSTSLPEVEAWPSP